MHDLTGPFDSFYNINKYQQTSTSLLSTIRRFFTLSRQKFRIMAGPGPNLRIVGSWIMQDFLMTRFVVWCFVVPSGLRNTAGPTIRLHCMGFLWYLWYLLMLSFWSCFSRYRDVILSVTCEMGRSKISLFGLHVDACAESWWEWSTWNGWDENWENGKHGTPPQNFGRTLKLEQSQNHPICCLKGRIHDSYPLLHGIHALGWRFTRFQICDAKLLRWVEIRKSTKGERWEGCHSCSGEASRHLEISTSDGSSTCLISDCFFWGCLWKLELGSTLQGGTKPETTLEPLPKLLKTRFFFPEVSKLQDVDLFPEAPWWIVKTMLSFRFET